MFGPYTKQRQRTQDILNAVAAIILFVGLIVLLSPVIRARIEATKAQQVKAATVQATAPSAGK